jgi:hypothetical protein
MSAALAAVVHRLAGAADVLDVMAEVQTIIDNVEVGS